MSLFQAFHNIFVDKYCLMYTEDNILTLVVVFRKNEVTEWRKCIVKWKDNTLRKHQVVIKQNISSIVKINKRTLGLEFKNQARQFNY